MGEELGQVDVEPSSGRHANSVNLIDVLWEQRSAVYDQFPALWEHCPWRHDHVNGRARAAWHPEQRSSRPMTEGGIRRQHAGKRPTAAIQLVWHGVDEIEAVRNAGSRKHPGARTTYQPRRCGSTSGRLSDQAELLSLVAWHPPTVSLSKGKHRVTGGDVDGRRTLWMNKP
ncbi:MAG: hypothetical protein M3443_03480 [Actinomycetota bacterium]|nr:hypothetical protein [Actinomycetota bacterium]